MPRKGKEPAGLRRYRLAQKRKRSGRKTRTLRAKPRKATSMARRRYGRKRRSGRKDKSIPVLLTMPVVIPAMIAYKAVGFTADLPRQFVSSLTGVNPTDGTINTSIMKREAAILVACVVGHKMANKFGINKHVKKMTGGYLKL